MAHHIGRCKAFDFAIRITTTGGSTGRCFPDNPRCSTNGSAYRREPNCIWCTSLCCAVCCCRCGRVKGKQIRNFDGGPVSSGHLPRYDRLTNNEVQMRLHDRDLRCSDELYQRQAGMRRFRRYLKPKLMRRHHIARLKHPLDELVKDDDNEYLVSICRVCA